MRTSGSVIPVLWQGRALHEQESRINHGGANELGGRYNWQSDSKIALQEEMSLQALRYLRINSAKQSRKTLEFRGDCFVLSLRRDSSQ